YPDAAKPLLDVIPSDDLYLVTGWGALEGHKVFYHETFINPNVAPDFIDRLKNQSFSSVWECEYHKPVVIKKLAFRPVRMSGDV
ncbi:GntR family transcriptional regulator, partial [Klebsiella pneumoniae]|nr:GntR family transcriptional regulator [Klebsiella pneumoniae]